MSLITILHLSDSHIGQPHTGHDQISVFDPLFEDLQSAQATLGLQPTAIVFSGDLVFGSAPSTETMKTQFSKAKEFLSRIYSALKSDLTKVPTIIVPGNHDIDRTHIDEPYLNYRNSFNEEKVRNLQVDQSNEWKRMLDRQKDWADFIQGYNQALVSFDSKFNMSSTILALGNTSLGIVGFNTAWSAQDNHDNGKIWLGIEQFQSGYQAIKDCKFRIAVAHHPAEYLHCDEKCSIMQKIEMHFNIFLHGHEHSTWFHDMKNHLKSAAGACYCGSSKKGNAYSWIQIDTDSGKSSITFREYTDSGKPAWKAFAIPNKTDNNGRANLIFNNFIATANVESSEVSNFNTPAAKVDFPRTIPEFCAGLENRYYVRKECAHSQCSVGIPIVYWPVRQREPAPIHAAQAFIAGGLSKLGCNVSLWIDNLGNSTYTRSSFEGKLKQWYERAGGIANNLTCRTFKEILDDKKHAIAAWDVLQGWLGNTAYYTDAVLKISKIWTTTDPSEKSDPSRLIQDLSNKRPRRLMNPSMVWTCLSVLHQENEKRPIITLGGHDERNLWDAWRTCCDFEGMQVCHLYVPKLTNRTNDGEIAIHMKETPLAWKSREDIEMALRGAIAQNDSPQVWDKHQSMIPWVINNCVLVPSYITNGTKQLIVGECPINSLGDLDGMKPSEIIGNLVGAASQWLL
jgi:hypothetical protein